MRIITTQVKTDKDVEATRWIRREVFEREMAIKLGPETVQGNSNVAQLVAYSEPGKEPAGTLSVIDTSGDPQLHASYGL